MVLMYRDNWEKLRELARLDEEVYTTEESLLSTEALEEIFSNNNAFDFLVNRCTGSFMVSFMKSEEAMEFLNNQKENNTGNYNKLKDNTNWNEFLTIFENL